MNDSIGDNYYALLVVGIVAVGFHAYSLFSHRAIDSTPNNSNSDLDLLPVISLAGKKNFSKGFLLYLTIFEMIYLVFASSSTLLSFVLNLANREETVGALSSLTEPNASIPVLASTALILLSQVKPFSRFEIYTREIGHSVSGIPNNVREIKESISLQISGIIANQDDANPDLSAPETSANMLREFRKRALNLKDKLLLDGVDTTRADTMFRSYCSVLYLHEVTMGYTGISTWQREETGELIELFRSIDYELDAMDALIRDYKHEGSTEAEASGDDAKDELPVNGNRTGKRWISVLEKCIHLEQRLLVLLALFFINRPDAQINNDPLLKEIMHESSLGDEPTLGNVLFASLTASLLLSVLVLTTYGHFISNFKSNVRESPYKNKLPFADIKRNSEFEIGALEKVIHGASNSERESDNQNWLSFASKLSAHVKFWFKEIFKPILIFITASAIALMYRKRAISSRYWRIYYENGIDKVPLEKYLTAGVYSYFATLFVMFFYHFLILALIPAVQNQTDFINVEGMQAMQDRIPEIFLFSLIAFFISYFVCDYADFRRWTKSARTAIGSINFLRVFVASMLCALTNGVSKIARNDVRAGWDLLDFFIIPFLCFYLFLTTFCYFAWVYENNSPERIRESSLQILLTPFTSIIHWFKNRTNNDPSGEPRGNPTEAIENSERAAIV